MLSNKSTQFAKSAVNRLLKQNQSVRFFGAAKSFVSFMSNESNRIVSCNIYFMYAYFYYSNKTTNINVYKNGILFYLMDESFGLEYSKVIYIFVYNTYHILMS